MRAQLASVRAVMDWIGIAASGSKAFLQACGIEGSAPPPSLAVSDGTRIEDLCFWQF